MITEQLTLKEGIIIKNKFLILAISMILLFTACSSKNESSNILTVVSSSAYITDTGLTSSIENQEPSDILGTAKVGDVVYAYAKIDNVDVNTRINIRLLFQDLVPYTSNLLVRQDGYVFAQIKIDEEGEYIVEWTLAGQDPIEEHIMVS